jgi:hypothetical protein
MYIYFGTCRILPRNVTTQLRPTPTTPTGKATCSHGGPYLLIGRPAGISNHSGSELHPPRTGPPANMAGLVVRVCKPSTPPHVPGQTRQHHGTFLDPKAGRHSELSHFGRLLLGPASVGRAPSRGGLGGVGDGHPSLSWPSRTHQRGTSLNPSRQANTCPAHGGARGTGAYPATNRPPDPQSTAGWSITG